MYLMGDEDSPAFQVPDGVHTKQPKGALAFVFQWHHNE